ncbi:MAG: STAS domain-containing protein, partial [bacterium]|nr:STAS domain-containing protein [bacterium]
MASTRITCPETLDRDTGKALLSDVQNHAVSQGDTVTLDFGGTKNMDALGGAWLVKVADAIRLRDGEFRFEGHDGPVAEFLDFIEPGLHADGTAKRRRERPLERLGELAIAVKDEAKDALNLTVD